MLALDGCLNPVYETMVSTVWEGGWVQGAVWILRRGEYHFHCQESSKHIGHSVHIILFLHCADKNRCNTQINCTKKNPQQ
jgi:hypothetical protein